MFINNREIWKIFQTLKDVKECHLHPSLTQKEYVHPQW